MRRRLRRDRGAVIVEFALVVPLLAMLAFGTAEVGLAWTAENRAQGAVSTATRVGVSSGSQREADRDILLALQAALDPVDLAGLDRVIVYRADDANGVVPAACKKAEGSTDEAPSPTSTACNTYSGATVRALTSANAGANGFSTPAASCTSSPSKKDRYWCPTLRKDSLTGPPDWLGVWIRVKHPNPIAFFFDEFTFEKSAVYRVQPDFTG